MEGLGAASACTELVAIAWSCIKFIKKVRHALKDFNEYVSQLETISEIATSISENKRLQTLDIENALGPVHETLLDLKTCLDYRFGASAKPWKSFLERVSFVTHDADLRKVFDRLEKQKSTLTLLFGSKNTSELTHMPELYNMVEGIYSETVDRATRAEHSPDTLFLVPPLHARLFVGRDTLLGQLEHWAAECVGSPTAHRGTRITLLRALGGQGKSQVAHQLCQRLRKMGYYAIMWVDATSESTLRGRYEALAKHLRSAEDDISSEHACVSLVLHKLQHSHQKWLMILDNYDDCKNFPNIRMYIPDSQHGSVVVTSRNADSAELVTDRTGQNIELPGLEEAEAIELFLRSSGRENGDRNIAARVVNSLAFHPLALAQAAAFVKKRRIHMEDFEIYFQRQKLEILNYSSGIALSHYQKSFKGFEKESALTVFTTWELTFKQLEQHERLTDDAYSEKFHALTALLCLCAFTSRTGLSQILFQHYVTPKEDVGLRSPQLLQRLKYLIRLDPCAKQMTWNKDNMRACVTELADLSLLQSFTIGSDGSTNDLTLHPLVRDWLRLRLPLDEQIDLVWKATSLVGSSLYEFYDHKFIGPKIDLPQRGQMLHHVQALIENYQNYPNAVPGIPTQTEYDRISGSKTNEMHLSDANDIFQDALEKLSLGTDTTADEVPITGTTAATSKVLSFPCSERFCSPSLPMELVLDLDSNRMISPTDATSMGDHAVNCLVMCMHFCLSIYRADVVQSLLECTLPDWEQAAIALPNNQTLCRLLLMHVQVPIIEMRDGAAETIAARFVALYDAHSASDDTKSIPAFYYGIALQNNLKFADAHAVFTRTAETRTLLWGSQDMMVLWSRGNSALCLSKLGQREEALELFQKTIATTKSALGPDCTVALDLEIKTLSNLMATGRADEAAALARDMLARFESALGEEHEETIRGMYTLSRFRRSAGREAEAEQLNERAGKLRAKAITEAST